MYANLASLKQEFGVSGGSGGGVDIGMGNITGVLSNQGPSAGPVHAFEVLNAAKCSSNQGLLEAINSMNMMDKCVMGPLRILNSIVSSLSQILGGLLPSLPLAEIGKLIGALTGGIQSLGCINLGIAKIHVKIQGQAQISSNAITSGVGGWTSFDTDMITNASDVRSMVKAPKKLKDILREKSKTIVKNTQAWHIAEGIRDEVKSSVTRVRGLVKQLDEKERQAMNTLDTILSIAHLLKSEICNILGLIKAFLSALQGVQIAIGIKGTIVAEVVQVLQAIMSILAQFLALLTDLLNFLTSLCVEAETISVKMFTNSLSSLKEKFRELHYAPFGTTGGI